MTIKSKKKVIVALAVHLPLVSRVVSLFTIGGAG